MLESKKGALFHLLLCWSSCLGCYCSICLQSILVGILNDRQATTYCIDQTSIDIISSEVETVANLAARGTANTALKTANVEKPKDEATLDARDVVVPLRSRNFFLGGTMQTTWNEPVIKNQRQLFRYDWISKRPLRTMAITPLFVTERLRTTHTNNCQYQRMDSKNQFPNQP